MAENGTLKWRFDVSTFRLIGRELITDRITALFELIKNCYDANATNVVVTFNNVGDESLFNTGESLITIQDDGCGMSFSDIRDKWMVIGTANKRTHTRTPLPFNRRCVGEKGIGRFAVDKLGDKVEILTKERNAPNWLKVDIDWNKYITAQTDGEINLFTDVDNSYNFITAEDINLHGTTLSISEVREKWSKNDIEKLITEVSKLVSPLAEVSQPMEIRVVAEEYGIDRIANDYNDGSQLATISFSLDYNLETQQQDVAYFNEATNSIEIKKDKLQSFGGIRMKLYYFDDSARRKYRSTFPNDQIDGIKIYRDGVIATPFAESESDDNKKRDVLGIDKRLWQDIFDRVSTREIIGFVEITKDGNPEIIDSTNRQDFVDNQEYKDLKAFIITQLNAVELFKKTLRKEKKKSNTEVLNEASSNISTFVSTIESAISDNPTMSKNLRPLIDEAKKVDKAVKQVIKDKEAAEEEFVRKENVYMSIMSLQEYAIHITHAVRTTLNKIRDKVFYFKKYFPDPTENDTFVFYANKMYDEFKTLNRVIDYMLSYSSSNLKPENIDLSTTLKEIVETYSDKFIQEGITIDLQLSDKLILQNSNRIFFHDILQNLLDNSIKAMKEVSYKIIRISAVAESNNLILKVSDTGCGIPVARRQWVFGIYNTTTENEGGAGIGLYVVKTRVESLRGKVFITDNETDTVGVTFNIELPFKH